MTRQDHPTDHLSPAGRARRDAIRDSLQSTVRRRGRTRRAAQAASALAALALLVTGAIALNRHQPAQPATPILPSQAIDRPAIGSPTPETAAPDSAAPLHYTARVAYVVNDDNVLDRVAATTALTRIERLDDQALLDQLDRAGLPAGLVRKPDRVSLAFHNTRPRPAQ